MGLIKRGKIETPDVVSYAVFGESPSERIYLSGIVITPPASMVIFAIFRREWTVAVGC